MIEKKKRNVVTVIFKYPNCYAFQVGSRAVWVEVWVVLVVEDQM
jgi:hypothetical protein